MLIKHPIAVAEVVFAILARIVTDKAMFRALAVAEVVELAVATLSRQQGALCHTELKLSVAVGKVCKAICMDISYLILGIDEVVAAVYIAIMFDGKSAAAGLAERADRWLHTHHKGKRRIEELDISSTHIVLDPDIEDIAHKLTKTLCTDRPRSDIRPLIFG